MNKTKTVTFEIVQSICNPQRTIGCNRQRSLEPMSFAFSACKQENCREWDAIENDMDSTEQAMYQDVLEYISVYGERAGWLRVVQVCQMALKGDDPRDIMRGEMRRNDAY